MRTLHVEIGEFFSLCIPGFDESRAAGKPNLAVAELLTILRGIAVGGDRANEKKNASDGCS